MIGWLTNKLKARRIAMSIAQLEYEIEASSPFEVAWVLVVAMDFSASFEKAGRQGTLIGRALELPSELNSNDAYAIYWNLEGLLISAHEQNVAAYAHAKSRMGQFSDNFRKDMKIMEMAMRLLLSRIAIAIDREYKHNLTIVARQLDSGIEHISEAVQGLRQMHSVTGAQRTTEHYEWVIVRARLYAFSYIASIYGSKPPHP